MGAGAAVAMDHNTTPKLTRANPHGSSAHRSSGTWASDGEYPNHGTCEVPNFQIPPIQ